MGIRQTLNENPVITAGATGAIIVIALIFIIVQAFGRHGGTRGRISGKAFFSDDDGKTWFADDAAKIPPIDHDGKPAYRVAVFRCADGTEFVARLERFSDEVKQQMEDQIKKNPNAAPVLQYTASMGALEVKRPGQPNWMKLVGSPPEEIRKIMQPVCPKDNSSNGVTQIRPE